MVRKKVIGFCVGLASLGVFSMATAATPTTSSGSYASQALGLTGTSSANKATVNSASATKSSGYLSDIPAWLSRVHGEATLDTSSSPHFALETIQPLWQSPDKTHTVFTQGRVSWTDDAWTMNFGGGYRYLAPDRTWLLGGNAFYDTQINDGHKRFGIGGEAMQSYLTLRTNLYKGFSGWKTIETAPNYIVQERALSGFDIGVDGPVPYLPWARLFTSFYQWDATARSDIHGIQTKVRMNLTQNVSLDLGGSADNDDYSLFTKIRLSLGSQSAEPTLSDKAFSAKAFEPRDLTAHTLDRVERQNEIVTERRTLAAGSVTGVRVVIRRGS